MLRDKTTVEHYNWGNHCDGWRLLDSPSLTVIQEKMPPGASEKKHFHEKAQQFFYILSGEAAFYFEEEKFLVKAGQGIHIPPGKIHFIKNETESAIEFLVISQPATTGDRIEI